MEERLEPVQVAAEVDALAAALDEARHRHVAGIDLEPDLSGAFARRPAAAHRETVRRLREAGEGALAARVATLRAERAAAGREERWRAAEARATGLGPDGPIGLADASLRLLAEPDRERRRWLGRALAEACEAAAPDREAWVEERARARAEVGLAPDWDAVVGGDELLAATDDAWADVLGWLARRELGLSPRPQGDLARADLLHLLALRPLEGAFRPGMLARELEGLASPLGLPLARIRVDAEPRPAKWPGAHAHGARVSFRPRGGAGDWQDLFLAAGAALAAAGPLPPHRRPLPFPAQLGSLLAGLLLEPAVLEKRLGVERGRLRDAQRLLALRQLFQLRCAAAALRLAAEADRGCSGAALREAHRDAFARATLADWPDVLAARDGGAERHAARLAGAARAEALRREWLERYDEDWWRNPRAAEGAAGLLVSGGERGARRHPHAAEGAAELLVSGGERGARRHPRAAEGAAELFVSGGERGGEEPPAALGAARLLALLG
ncbi:hypothetical protein [Anaeromyxobacter paludicola]|uniref:Uncharacterized protein n=1 Tax=Anaeromyxobacter paludicola TaxID=2918171 RepID=A0ABN6N8J9_9BACT|nr:hypothetical protein [Anaeromyxobacter paludicola]BDG09545.1 hypothetical protein AMPC_26580 [Anaeromyxobacter paludicola]